MSGSREMQLLEKDQKKEYEKSLKMIHEQIHKTGVIDICQTNPHKDKRKEEMLNS